MRISFGGAQNLPCMFIVWTFARTRKCQETSWSKIIIVILFMQGVRFSFLATASASALFYVLLFQLVN